MRIAAAAVVAGACGIGTALAQVVPDRVQGEYAIGSCGAPEVTVTIDGTGMTVVDAAGQTLASVTAQSAQDVGGQVEMQVTVDGTPGAMTLVDLGDGALNVLYTEQGGTPEAPQRLELCVAAGPGPITPETPPTDGARVPDVLLGEFATGSCDAPEELLVVEATRMEAFTGTTSNGVVQVLAVSEIQDGYALTIEVEGTRGTLEMSIINQDIVEAVFVPEGGAAPAPETLYRCTPMVVADDPVVDDPVVDDPVDEPVSPVLAGLPAEVLGRYALGSSCEQPEMMVEILAGELQVFEGDELSSVITVTGVTATSPDLTFTVTSPDGEIGDVLMESTAPGQYRVTFTDRATGRVENPETLTLCETAAIDDGPAMPSGTVGGYLFEEPAARFATLMAELETTCQVGSEQACLDTFWTFADITGDGQLTGAEMARVVRYAIKYGVAENMPAPRLGQQVAVHLGSMVTAPLIANGMIYNHDYDGNNALSQVELFPDGVAAAPLAVPALMELISESTLEDVFEALEELERM